MDDNINGLTTNFFEATSEMGLSFLNQITAYQSYFTGSLRYINEFHTPFLISLNSFANLEKEKLRDTPIIESIKDYVSLFQFNQQMAEKGNKTSIEALTQFHTQEMEDFFLSWLPATCGKGENLLNYSSTHAILLKWVVRDFPDTILNIKSEYGFHFNKSGYEKVAETDRMLLYQVFPNDKNIEVNKKAKPVVIIPPYVLGANILCFLPGEGKSYVHAFANQGIPTYIRIIKDIKSTVAVQTMSLEDDTLDTKLFCEILKKRHSQKVTLNGFCQGGFIALLNILSGELDATVDALITCVAPIDGTRSKSLNEYLKHLPERFRDLDYALKEVPGGNRVVDGKVMSWVYKLKSIEEEAPLFTFYRDLMMFNKANGNNKINISKTAAAINYWLIYDRSDLPEAITKASFDSYTIPITKDGVMPIKLFNKELNIKHIKKLNIKYLICYADKDTLVDKEAALAPLDYVDAEVTVFPKGHGSIATSWSKPESKCALHTYFGKNYRGPVRFQLDIQSNFEKE